jgi:hypothetical protein
MSLRYLEGFEGWSNPETFWFFGHEGSFSIDTTGGRFGGHALTNALSGGGESLLLLDGFNESGAIVGFAYKFAIGGKATNIMRWHDHYPDGTIIPQLELRKTSNDILQIASNGTVLATGTHPLFPNRYYYIEWKALIATHLDTTDPTHPKWVLDNSASNTNQVRVDGVVECTVPSGTSNVGNENGPGYYQPSGVAVSIPYRAQCGILYAEYDQFQLAQHFDDFYVADLNGTVNNDYLGDISVNRLAPSAVGTHNAWTVQGALSAHAAVNETEPDGDTSFVFDKTPGDLQTFTFPNMKSNSVSVPGIAINAVMRKDDITTRTIAHWVNAASTTADTSATPTPVGDNYAAYYNGWDTDPTGAAWTASTVNAMEAGVKLVS